MPEVALALKDEDGTLIEKIRGTFEPSEVELLRRFVGFVDRVRETTLLRRGMPNITNVHFSQDAGLKFTCGAYSNAELHELLHVLRPLILSKESTSFEKVAGLLGKRFESDNFRSHLKLQRTVYDHGELKLYMQISLADQALFDDSTLKLWLNGEQYHTDDEKASAWKEFESALTTENARALVITQLQGKVKALFNLQYIAGLVLEKADA
jgi:hypothetical protein